MEEKTTKKTFVGGAAVLGISGLLVKVIGAVFRIPLANIIGDEGMGYYQTAFPIYTALLAISTSGIPTAISRMVAERRAKGSYRESYRIYRYSLWLMTGIGVFTGLVMAVFAPQICSAIKEPNAIWCMYSLAPALVVCPIISSIRGYFQGQSDMMPTAVSQIFEQIFRVVPGFVLAMVFMDKGLEYAAAGATSGAAFGGISALICLLIMLAVRKKTIIGEFEPEGTFKPGSGPDTLKEILSIAVPITLGGLIMPIINSIDIVIVRTRLISIGYDPVTARSLFGQLSGMASPVINMPDAITVAVCMSLVPVIADARLRNDTDFVKKNSELSLRYACIVGMPCSIGVLALAKPIMLLLYPLQKEAAISAAGCLAAYAPGIALLAITQAFSGILQGIGKQQLPVRNMFIGAVIKVIATYILCGIASVNVLGAAYGTVITYGVSALLNFFCVRKYTGTRFNFSLCILKPLIASAVMGIAAYLCYGVLAGYAGNAVATLVSVAAGAVIYAVLIIVLKAITPQEIKGLRRK